MSLVYVFRWQAMETEERSSSAVAEQLGQTVVEIDKSTTKLKMEFAR